MREYKEEDYSTIFGVKKTFDAMVLTVENQYEVDHQKGGRKDGPTVQERVEITLKYLRQYVSQRYLAQEYNVAKSSISSIVKWTEKVLVKSRSFSLPNRVQNISDKSEPRIIDVTESKIDRPSNIKRTGTQVKRKCTQLKLK